MNQIAARFRNDELQVRVVCLQLHDVTGIGLRDRDVACCEIVGVVVAGEPADLALVLLFANEIDGLLDTFGGGVLVLNCPATA